MLFEKKEIVLNNIVRGFFTQLENVNYNIGTYRYYTGIGTTYKLSIASSYQSSLSFLDRIRGLQYLINNNI